MPYSLDWCVPLECITREELLERIERDSNFILIDTVGKYDGNRFKIRGATTIPYPEVIDRRREIMNYDEVIIYCMRKSCSASKKVAAALTLLKIPNVKVYEGGIEEWKENNLPAEEV